jgi:hypothetical protein
MKIEKGKYLTYSKVFLTFGWLYVFLIDYLNYIDFSEQFIDGILFPFASRGKYDTIWFKLIGIGFGAFSLYFGYKSKSLNQKRLRIFLISISLILIIMSISPFPNLIIEY